MKDKYKKEALEVIVKKSFSVREICRNLEMSQTGRNTVTIKKYITYHNIDVSHFLSSIEVLKQNHFKQTTPINEVFIQNSKYTNNTGLKKKIIDNQLIKYECQKCKNIGEWNGFPLTLHIDHISGINDDHRISNLRFLCPNCHSQTDTYSGKHLGQKALKNKERELNNGLTTKQILSFKKSRKIDRPNIEILNIQLKEGSFSSVGRIYNVSDNTIRKWCKSYGMSTKKDSYK